MLASELPYGVPWEHPYQFRLPRNFAGQSLGVVGRTVRRWTRKTVVKTQGKT